MIGIIIVLFCAIAVIAYYQIGSIFLLVKSDNQGAGKNKSLNASFIIPHRNEGLDIQSFQSHLNSLLNQYSDFEVIWVNDHSAEVHLNQNESDIFVDLNESEQGKKQALRIGIESASFDRVVTLDADIRINSNVLDTICEWDNSAFLLPVITKGNGFVQAESYAIAGLTCGTAKMGRALMANGACLAFDKKVYEKLNLRGDKWASGDDMFLLEALKKEGYKVDTVWSNETYVVAKAPLSLKKFIDQRVRWSSKNKALMDIDVKLFGTATFLLYFGLSFGLFFIEDAWHWQSLVLIFGFKSIIDFSLLFLVASQLGLRQLPLWYLILAVLYPLYVMMILSLALVYKPKWKGRQLTNV